MKAQRVKTRFTPSIKARSRKTVKDLRKEHPFKSFLWIGSIEGDALLIPNQAHWNEIELDNIN